MKQSTTTADNFLRTTRAGLALVALLQSFFGSAVQPASAANPTTPIQHVIVIVGENRTFDHIFATYQPVSTDTVNNLFSEGIVKADGSPGPNYSKAVQHFADVTGNTDFQLAPTSGKTAYINEPAPLNGGPTDPCTSNGICNIGDAYSSEHFLSSHPLNYYQYMLTGGSGL
ncbi:MAG TPA: alkaline phosphatase family protein, partial [Candidatus Binatia bacterium]|nr:alkaline phosphatase family protein [Candidatus Binatia bacterium]